MPPRGDRDDAPGAAGPLDRLVDEVRAGAKYRNVCEEAVRNIGRKELPACRSFKEAVKATKNKLHQVAGAYLTGKPPYAEWIRTLEDARSDSGRIRDLCLRIMASHASTRERLPILDEFYAATLSGIGPIRSVLDVACGFNPLAIPWMPLAPDARYLAFDLYTDLARFLDHFFQAIDMPGRAGARDIVASPPEEKADIALLLKALPPVEQLDRGAGLRLLRALNADHLLVSFPRHTLGGRNKGMAKSYERRFLDLIGGEGWPVDRFEFSTEIAFRIGKTRR